MSTMCARVILSAGLALAASCSKSDRVAGTPPTTAATTAPVHPAPHAATPPVNAAVAARVGAVVETMNAGGYTYVKLDLGNAQVWAAGPETKVAVGDRLQLVTGTTMTGFHSSTLDRTFDRIEFVPSLPREGAPVVAPTAAAATAAVVTEAIAPAAGGQAIAATLAGAKALAGKPITVRGKVVKFNAGILGRNWIHLQDGTGDLTLTTAPTAAPLTLGTVVVMRGTLAIDQDFGGGYRYPVLVQDAAVVAP